MTRPDFYNGKRILITGGGGYIGTNLAAALSTQNCLIIRLVRRPPPPLPLTGKARLECREGDIEAADFWKQILPDVDIIFHLAAQTSAREAAADTSTDLRRNILPLLHLFETCRKDGLQPVIVYASTATIAGLPRSLPVNEDQPDNPLTIYDLHKKMAEQYLRHYAQLGFVRGVSLRLANVYGPGPASSRADRGVLNQMISRGLRGETLTVFGDGAHLRDYVYIRDVVEAFVAAGAHSDQIDGRHFVIGSGRGHTIAQAVGLVATRVEKKTGQHISVRHVSPPAPLAAIENRNFVADSRRFAEATGWQARVTLPEGIDLTLESLL